VMLRMMSAKGKMVAAMVNGRVWAESGAGKTARQSNAKAGSKKNSICLSSFICR
jgi:hypothetical protein